MPDKTYSFDEQTQTLTVYSYKGVHDYCKDNGLMSFGEEHTHHFDFSYKVVIDHSVTDCGYMFQNCHNFNQPVVIPQGATECMLMFENCYALNQPITIPDSVENCYAMFEGCRSFNQHVDMPPFVEQCGSMFKDCKEFNQPVTIPEFAKDCTQMFKGCTSLNSPVVIGSNVETTTAMFKGCTAFNQKVDIPPSVKNCYGMFDGCTSYNQDKTIPGSASRVENMYSGTKVTLLDIAKDADLAKAIIRKHFNAQEWFEQTFPDGAPSKDAIRAKLEEEDDDAPKSAAGSYTLDTFLRDVPTLIKVMEKHLDDYEDWFATNFPNGASSAEEVLSKLKEE